MVIRFLSIFLIPVVAALGSPTLHAQSTNEDDTLGDIIAPDLERREIKVGKIDTENWEVGGFVGIMNIEDFGAETVVGARLSYHVTEYFFTEFAFGATRAGETSFELLSGSTLILTDEQRDLTYFNANLGVNIFKGEIFVGKNYAFNSDLYLVAGLGNTNFADDNFLTYTAGFGTRLLFTDWFSIHANIRAYSFTHEILGPSMTILNLEPSIGATIFF